MTNQIKETEVKAHINDIDLFYTTHGQGRPLLVMHGGLGLDHTYFRPWLDELSSQVELIYYDHRGNGRSTRPDNLEGVGHDTWAADADALRAYLGHERIILFGHSYGSFLAQEYALRYGDRLDGLILSSTAPVIDYFEVIQANAQARATAEQLEGVNKVFSTPMADDADFQQTWLNILPVYFKTYDPQAGAAMDETTHYSAAAWNHVNAHCLSTFNVLSRLGEISVPTLVMTGREDWITPPVQGAERIHAALPNSNLVIFEQSGHFPFIEEHDKFIDTVTDWIASLG